MQKPFRVVKYNATKTQPPLDHYTVIHSDRQQLPYEVEIVESFDRVDDAIQYAQRANERLAKSKERPPTNEPSSPA